MKKFVLLIVALAVALPSVSSAVPIKSVTVQWRTSAKAYAAPGTRDSSYVTKESAVSDTTAAISLADWDFPDPAATAAATDSAKSFLQFALIPKSSSAVTVAADTIYVTPQLNFGEDSWIPFTSVPTLVVLEQGTSNCFVVKLNQGGVTTPVLKNGIQGARAIRFIVLGDNTGQWVGSVAYPSAK